MEEKKKVYTRGSMSRIGPKLRKLLDLQKDKIRKVCYDCVDPSDYEAGEIIAGKMIDSI